MDLGTKVLELPDFVIKTALYDMKDIQPATHKILSTWLKQQANRKEAYVNILAGLRKCEMNQHAIELQQWVEGTAAEISGSPEKGEYVPND